MADGSSNRAGPSTLWKTLKGKDVKTNDGQDIGEIKEVSENYLLLEKGKVRKQKFWIPKYVVAKDIPVNLAKLNYFNFLIKVIKHIQKNGKWYGIDSFEAMSQTLATKLSSH